MKFKSEYADTADELLQLKNRAFEEVMEKKERLQLVRDFTNMKDTMTEAEARELGISEITNHGQTYRAMSANQSQYQSMVTRTNALLDLKVDTDIGKPSRTRYETLERWHGASRLALTPLTGRSHQLREIGRAHV